MRDTLNETTKRIVEEADPDKIILFGSRIKNRTLLSCSLLHLASSQHLIYSSSSNP